MTIRWREFARPSLILCLLLAAATGQAADTGPIVAVTGGQVQGAPLEKGGAVFRGIPFAAPPVGALRWREPMPVVPWTGVRDATKFGAPCAQDSPFVPNAKEVSKEDCLYLNVWTPALLGGPPKPVMVWVPGGGNYGGAGSQPTYDGDKMVQRGVVLVTMNYRLGVFGFFSQPELTRESPNHASGNQGFLDQIAALTWVRDNIARFGGDPGNVTLFGESAGSIDISAVMASPLAKGLFVRVIGESGAVLGVGDPMSLAEAEKLDEKSAVRWGLAADAPLKELRAVSVADILKLEPNFPRTHPDLGVTVDGYVFPKNPAAVFAAGQELKVSLLIGNNARDHEPGLEPPADLEKAVDDLYGPLATRALALYGTADDPLYGPPAAQWAGDKSFRCSAVAQLAWHVAAGNTGYEYEFARAAPGREAVGATHASELSYVFGTLDHGIVAAYAPPTSGPIDIDRRISDVMQQYWTNFAKTGDPDGDGLPPWPKFDAASRAYVEFTDAGPVAKAGLRRPFCDLFIENAKRLVAR